MLISPFEETVWGIKMKPCQFDPCLSPPSLSSGTTITWPTHLSSHCSSLPLYSCQPWVLPSSEVTQGATSLTSPSLSLTAFLLHDPVVFKFLHQHFASGIADNVAIALKPQDAGSTYHAKYLQKENQIVRNMEAEGRGRNRELESGNSL